MIASHLHQLLAQARSEQLRSAAATPCAARRRRHARTGTEAAVSSDPVTLRFCFPDDREALARLAALDSAEPLLGPVLLAEVDGELRAALSLHDGSVVADPFRHTLSLIDLLRARASQLRQAERPRWRQVGRWRAAGMLGALRRT